MKTIFNPNGRITRRRYLLFFTVCYFINLLCLLQMYEAFIDQNVIVFVVSGILLITTIVFLFVSAIQRLHDIGLDWKYALYLLIPPPINLVGFVWLAVKEGQPGSNQYGPDPRDREDIIS
ncbi:MAG TPA: DUF805 domain-containing protein [Cyclobacteriaceae bacterium]|nr:DUF805 domain-containing protein [Cyclobacteriaceae bacterium]